MPNSRDALITGIGLISCLGEGVKAHWTALTNPDGLQPILETDVHPGFAVHPMTPLTLDTQIPKRDQRQMEAWQRIGVYAAGLALDSAGVKGNTDLLNRMEPAKVCNSAATTLFQISFKKSSRGFMPLFPMNSSRFFP